MTHRDSEEEKLIGEIYEELSRFAGHVVRYQADGDRHAEHECKMVFANSITGLVRSAFRDGMALPGEAGRTTREFMMGEGIPPDQMLHWWLDARLKEGATRFIALRPLSGAGKEEKK